MKIQCNVCETAEAAVLCCADEAALCLACDEKVHTANKLAGNTRECLSLSLPLPYPNAIFVRKLLDSSFVCKIELCYVGNVM